MGCRGLGSLLAFEHAPSPHRHRRRRRARRGGPHRHGRERPGPEPTSGARSAGITEPGQAYMGWRERATRSRPPSSTRAPRASPGPPRPSTASTSRTGRARSTGPASGRRAALRVCQGHGGHELQEPLLQPPVHRLLHPGLHPRLVPLRAAGPLERDRPGGLVRQQRRRLVGGRQDAARRARHGVEPLRRHVLRQDAGRHGDVDPGLREPVQGPHRPRPGHLHEYELVEPVRRPRHPLRRRGAAVDRAVQHRRGHPADRVELLHLLAVLRHPIDQNVFNGSLDRLRALATG